MGCHEVRFFLLLESPSVYCIDDFLQIAQNTVQGEKNVNNE